MRAIDAEEFECVTLKNCSDEFAEGTKYILEMIDKAPTVTKQGHWIFLPEKDKTCKRYWWDCSECGKRVGEGLDILVPTDYCPSCGAEMDKEEF